MDPSSPSPWTSRWAWALTAGLSAVFLLVVLLRPGWAPMAAVVLILLGSVGQVVVVRRWKRREQG